MSAIRREDVGVVAIGRNEGERLRRCLESALRDAPHVVYVDSGSRDGSVELARGLGAGVVELDLAVPFTAARARNAGLARLREVAPDARAVQFVDGDCELARGWLDAARAALDAEDDVVVVCGRRRERHPEASVYNLLCDMEWDTPVGEVRSCGGDALMRVDAFLEVGGFREEVIAGEEPDLCFRLRQRGGRILRIDADMTWHDAAMTRFGQWWTRQRRAGWACAGNAHRNGGSPERFQHPQLRSVLLWTLALPLLTVAATLLHPAGLFVLLAYPAQILRVAARRRGGGHGARAALHYGWSCVLGKFPMLLGVLAFHRDRLRGRRARIIEYK